MPADVVGLPTTLSPLPPTLHQGLIAVSVLGLLSFITSVVLGLYLGYRLATWTRRSQARVNQFMILIFSVVLADIQQSIAFLLSAHWLHLNSIEVHTSACWAQAWFVSTGDLASAVFTFAIAIHSFGDIIFDFRLGHRAFLASIACSWVFVYTMAIVGIGMHPKDFFVRAGAWCWINGKYNNLRLYLCYMFIIIAEFSTVIIYTLIVLILRRRVKESFYTTSDTQVRAQSAAKLIVAYPIVYVLCTLPLVMARLTSLAGGKVNFAELCVAGAFITSNGWLDVLLYCVTRRALIFGPELDATNTRALDTFRHRPDQSYGVTTTIGATGQVKGSNNRLRRTLEGQVHSRNGSTEELFGLRRVKAQTTVQVQSEAVELDLMSDGDMGTPKGRVSVETRSASER